jgi:hypothetical protein
MKRFLPGMRRCFLLFFLSLGALLGCQVLFGDVEISDPPDVPPDIEGAECMPGDYRCYQENLFSCGEGNTGWVSHETCALSEFCDSRNKRCLVCKDGDFRCDGARRETCSVDRASWTLVEECPAADMCSPYQCGPCTPGTFGCSGKAFRKCGDNQAWQTLAECASEWFCGTTLARANADPTVTTCDPPGCDPGHRCQGEIYQRCPQDPRGWDNVDSCDSSQLCNKTLEETNRRVSMGLPPLEMCLIGCERETHRCEGMTLQKCSDDLTEYVPVLTCEAGTECNPTLGSCSELCTPGEYQCNGTVLRQCRPDRSWTPGTDCVTAALCDASGGRCIEPACAKPGDFKCEGNELFECNVQQTRWEPRGTCASAKLCNAASKQCDMPVCTEPGLLRCAGQELVECSKDLDAWIIPRGGTERIICPVGQYCDANPNSFGCKTECPAAAWCAGRVLNRCAPNTATGVEVATCATDDLCRCAVTDPDGAATNTCPNGLETNGCGKPACSPNEHRCTNGQLQRCNASRTGWEKVVDCPANLCVPNTPPSAGYCATCPTAGELQCFNAPPNAEVRICSSDRQRWSVTDDCQALPCRNNGTMDYCAVCAEGDANCTGTGGRILEVCASDQRGFTSKDCGSGNLCDEVNRQCDVCIAGTARCNTTGTLITCSADGQTETTATTPCATPALCDAANKRCITPACAVNERKCTTDGQPQRCNANRTGFVDDGTKCATPDLCVDGSCITATCAVNERKCNLAQPQICNAARTGFQNEGPACATAELCNETTPRCDEPACDPGARCMGNTLYTCNAGRTAEVTTNCASRGEMCVGTAPNARCEEPPTGGTGGGAGTGGEPGGGTGGTSGQAAGGNSTSSADGGG